MTSDEPGNGLLVRNHLSIAMKQGDRIEGVAHETIASFTRRVEDGRRGDYPIEVRFDQRGEAGGWRVVLVAPGEIASIQASPCFDEEAIVVAHLTVVTREGDRFSGPVDGTCDEAAAALNHQLGFGGMVRLPFTDGRGTVVVHAEHFASIAFRGAATWPAPSRDET